MKVVANPIEVLSWTDLKGNIHPLRFRIENEVIQINKIIDRIEEKDYGIKKIIFECQVKHNGELKLCELRYEIISMRWILYKI